MIAKAVPKVLQHSRHCNCRNVTVIATTKKAPLLLQTWYCYCKKAPLLLQKVLIFLQKGDTLNTVSLLLQQRHHCHNENVTITAKKGLCYCKRGATPSGKEAPLLLQKKLQLLQKRHCYCKKDTTITTVSEKEAILLLQQKQKQKQHHFCRRDVTVTAREVSLLLQER